MSEMSIAVNPRYSSVEARIQQLRKRKPEFRPTVALGMVQGIVEDPEYTDAERVRYVANVIAALDEVRCTTTDELGFAFSREVPEVDETAVMPSRRVPAHLEDGRTGEVVEVRTCEVPS